MQKITTGQPLQHPTPWVYIVLHLPNGAFFPYCRVYFVARKISPYERFYFVQQVARYGSVISYCSVHLDARQIPPRLGMKCGDFWACFFVQQVARYGSVISYCSVHLDARMNHTRNVIQPFREFTISCNKLHATGALFHIVACILMHDRITHGTLFTTSGIHDFVQQVARYGSVIP